MNDYLERVQRLDQTQRAALARELQLGRPRLVAFVVPRADATADAAALREHLATRVADYMLPGRFVTTTALPRTAHGKLDARALEALLSAPARSRGADTPSAASQDIAGFQGDAQTIAATLTEIWCAVLDMERIYPDDDYFELGGDSLASLTIIARCAKQNIHFSPADLLRHPTIDSLTAWLAATGGVAAAEQSAAAEPAAKTDGDAASRAEMLRVLKLDGRAD
ncbi:MAG: phosphopantetheine-binding protein [Pseudomonadota bacterium]